jgi:hypothetical protein
MRGTSADFAPDLASPRLVAGSVRSAADVLLSDRKSNQDPHILLATTGQLPSTARLAMELHEAGARVSLIAPNNHPARALDLLSKRLTYRALAPRFGLQRAILRLQPDMVIPCD